jgi:hypothetical protein
MQRIALSGIAVALSAGGVLASPVLESEPNDTIATADFIGAVNPLGGAIAVDGRITEGDVDWFRLDLNGLTTLLISTIGSTTPGADGQLMVVDGSGTDVLAWDDDSGVDLLPALQLFNLSAGTYYIGVSAFPDITGSDNAVDNDILFDGLDANGLAHTENFDYKLSIAVNIVPAPGAVALLGLGGLAAARRRR